MAGQRTTERKSVGRPRKTAPFQVHRAQEFGSTNSRDTIGSSYVNPDGPVDPTLVDMALPRKIGYVRVSKTEQETALQLAALRGFGCELIFEEKISSVAKQRPAFEACLAELQPGDTLVVWKLDRLGRKTVELISLVESLSQRGIGFVCTTQGFDTSTPMGKAFLAILAAFAQLERDTIVERTRAGLEAARAMGHFGGGRRSLTGEKLERARAAYYDRPIDPATGKRMSNRQLAAMFGVSKITLQNWVLHDGVPTWKAKRLALLGREVDLDAWRERTNDPMWGRNPNKVRKAS